MLRARDATSFARKVELYLTSAYTEFHKRTARERALELIPVLLGLSLSGLKGTTRGPNEFVDYSLNTAPFSLGFGNLAQNKIILPWFESLLTSEEYQATETKTAVRSRAGPSWRRASSAAHLSWLVRSWQLQCV